MNDIPASRRKNRVETLFTAADKLPNFQSKHGNPVDFICEYLLCNFFAKFSCNHNILCLEFHCCPLNGVSLKIGGWRKPVKRAKKSDFPDRSSVLNGRVICLKK
jgi:hypothetical protein